MRGVVLLKLNKVLLQLMFLSILFIGADLLALEVIFTFKLSQLFFLVTFVLLLATKKYRFRKDNFMFFFMFTSLLSTVFALNPLLGIAYYLYILFNVFLVYYVLSSYVEMFGIKATVHLVRLTFFVQFWILVFQYILVVVFQYEIPFMRSYGTYFGVPRFRLWFFEPSYMATYVLFWFTLALTMFLKFKNKSYIKDLICSSCMLIMSTSTAGFVGILVAFILVWILTPNNKRKFVAPIIGLLLLALIPLFMPDMFEIFFMRLFNTSLNSASGGRISKWSEPFNVFLDKPLLGVGPGNYGFYFNASIEKVPSNVTLELLATLGVWGLIFYAIHLKLFYKAYRIIINTNIPLNEEKQLLYSIVLGVIVFVIILQANQGYLRLYHWMLLGLLFGGIKSTKDSVKE